MIELKWAAFALCMNDKANCARRIDMCITNLESSNWTNFIHEVWQFGISKTLVTLLLTFLADFLVMLAHARIVENLPTFIVLSGRWLAREGRQGGFANMQGRGREKQHISFRESFNKVATALHHKISIRQNCHKISINGSHLLHCWLGLSANATPHHHHHHLYDHHHHHEHNHRHHHHHHHHHYHHHHHHHHRHHDDNPPQIKYDSSQLLAVHFTSANKLRHHQHFH